MIRLFKLGWCRRWLSACLGWLLLSGSWLAHGQTPYPSYPFLVRATISLPVPTTGSQPVNYQALGASVVYPAFDPDTGFDKIVNAVVVQPDGRIVVGGNFDTYQVSSRNHLVRLLLDGSRDPSFNPPTLNGQVSSLALQPDGKILVGGSFNNLGTTHNYLVRLDTNGNIDSDFSFTGNGLDGAVTTIALQADGMVLIGGSFINYGTTANNCKGLARLTTTGALDVSFSNTVGAPSSRIVTSIVVQANQQIVVGGLWGANLGSGGATLMRLNSTGSTDNTFKTNIASLPSEGSNTSPVTALAEKDGKLLVARQTLTQRHLFQLTSAGNISNTLLLGTATTDAISTLAFQANDKILVGGDFHLSNGTTHSYLARLEANFTPDAGFTSAGGPTGKVTALAVQASQQVLVGGDFTGYNTNSVTANRLVRVETGGALNTFATDLSTTYPFTYAWSNGSTGRVSAALANGPYSATATLAGVATTSNTVTASILGAGGTPSSPVRITPTGPLSVCAGNSQTLTALLPGGVSATYRWWKVQVVSGLSITVSSVGSTTTGTTGSSYSVSSPSSPEQYFATAVVSNTTAASAAVMISQTPAPVTPSAVTGLPGTGVDITGNNLQMVTAVTLGATGSALSFVLNSPTRLTVAIPATATNGAVLAFKTACGPSAASTTTLSVPPLAVTSFAPQQGGRGSSVVLTGTGFIAGATAVSFNGVSATSVVVASSTQLTAVVPPSAPIGAGPLLVAAAGVSVAGPANFTVSAATPMTISNTRTLPAGMRYSGDLIITALGNVTVSGSGTGPNGNIGIVVDGRLEVQDGATLTITGSSVVVGGAGSSFLLAAGATLNVGHPLGLSNSPASGAIQSLTKFFSSDASYGYIGTQPQVTGDGLPNQVRSLTHRNNSGLTLTLPVSIRQVLKVAGPGKAKGTGSFYLNNQPLTLLSSATGTALVVDSLDGQAGQVVGTATVQRYINPVANTGQGFRYYGSPVTGATATTLLAPVFDYDQSRPFVQQDTLPPFGYGFATVPLLSSAALSVGRGYRAVVPAATTVQFTGTLTTGDLTLTLSRTGQAAYNGWHLVSNPYPAPLNWSKLLAAGGAVGLDAAVYVYESTGTNTGRYRSYVNGVSNDGLLNRNGNGELLIATGQAFFVRVRRGLPSGTLTFRNDYRATAYTEQASFSRLAVAPFELGIELERDGSGGGSGGCSRCSNANRVALYVDPAGVTSATQAFNLNLDADAGDLFSFSQQTLSLKGSPTDSSLAIRAIVMPVAGQVRRFPLIISTNTPGNFVLRAAVNQNQLPRDVYPFLHDIATNTWVNLSSYTSASPLLHPFFLSPSEALKSSTTRFEICFGPLSIVNATSASSALGSAAVFPNPARQQVNVWVPAVPAASHVQAVLLNGLGQVVYQQTAALPAAGTTLTLATQHLAGGVYILRLRAGELITTRRVVLEQ